AITRAPIAAPSIVALSPTGPCPNTASVSRPDTSSRFSAPYAVPVPQATAAPSSNVSSSGTGTFGRARTLLYSACAPSPVAPYAARAARDSCDPPPRQCLQRPQPL